MGMNPTKKIRSTVRNTKRVSEVLTVLISHGFENVLIETGLARLFGKGRRLIGSKNKKSNIDQPWASRLRQVLEELGPTFIKMGQILATRPDLIPVTWAEEFKKLQSGAPSVEFAKIEAKLEDAFGSQFEDLFESVDPNPLGSASIAQVHRGVLKTGERVVIKIVKPGIKNTIKADMEVLAMMAGLVEHHFSNLGYSPKQVAREFSRELNREVNLMNEGQSCDRLNMLFQDSKKVSFPKVYWEATNSDVLTMSEAEGTLLSQLNRDDMELPLRQELLKTGADAIFRQCLEFGFSTRTRIPGTCSSKKTVRSRLLIAG